MSKLRQFLSLTILVGAFTVFGALPVSAQEPEQTEQEQPESDQPEPELVLNFLLPGEQEDVEAGQSVRISVYLIDPAGNPIEGGEISFTLESTFMNVVGGIELGTDITDIAGLAEVNWEPRSEGENLVIVRFPGDDIFTPVTVEDVLVVNPGPDLYTEASPLRVFGANVWMVVSILSVVWGLYAVALGFGIRIARAGGAP